MTKKEKKLKMEYDNHHNSDLLVMTAAGGHRIGPAATVGGRNPSYTEFRFIEALKVSPQFRKLQVRLFCFGSLPGAGSRFQDYTWILDTFLDTLYLYQGGRGIGLFIILVPNY